MPSKFGLGLVIVLGAITALAAIITLPRVFQGGHAVTSAVQAAAIARPYLGGSARVSVERAGADWLVSNSPTNTDKTQFVMTVTVDSDTGHARMAGEEVIKLEPNLVGLWRCPPSPKSSLPPHCTPATR